MSARPDIDAIRPTVVIDTREQRPLVFRNLPSRRGMLKFGDYSFEGAEDCWAIERKTISDLAACCKSGKKDTSENERRRFEEELRNLSDRSRYRYSRLLIIGGWEAIRSHQYRSQIAPKSVLHSLYAWDQRYIPVVMMQDATSAARLVEHLARWGMYEMLKEQGQIEDVEVFDDNANKEAQDDNESMQVG